MTFGVDYGVFFSDGKSLLMQQDALLRAEVRKVVSDSATHSGFSWGGDLNLPWPAHSINATRGTN